MKIFALTFLLIASIALSAEASKICPSTDMQFEQSILVAYGTFERVLQTTPYLRCADDTETGRLRRTFDQCVNTIEQKTYSYDLSRLVFRTLRILKIDPKAAGSNIDIRLSKDDPTPQIMLPQVIVEGSPELKGKEGILFATGKNALNDLTYATCGFIDKNVDATQVEKLLALWPKPLVVTP